MFSNEIWQARYVGKRPAPVEILFQGGDTFTPGPFKDDGPEFWQDTSDFFIPSKLRETAEHGTCVLLTSQGAQSASSNCLS